MTVRPVTTAIGASLWRGKLYIYVPDKTLMFSYTLAGGTLGTSGASGDMIEPSPRRRCARRAAPCARGTASSCRRAARRRCGEAAQSGGARRRRSDACADACGDA